MHVGMYTYTLYIHVITRLSVGISISLMYMEIFANHCDKTRGIIYHDEINYKSLIKQAPAVVNCVKEQKNV